MKKSLKLSASFVLSSLIALSVGSQQEVKAADVETPAPDSMQNYDVTPQEMSEQEKREKHLESILAKSVRIHQEKAPKKIERMKKHDEAKKRIEANKEDRKKRLEKNIK